MKRIFRRKIKNKLQPVKESSLVATEEQLTKLVGKHILVFKGHEWPPDWYTWYVKVNGRIVGHLHQWATHPDPNGTYAEFRAWREEPLWPKTK